MRSGSAVRGRRRRRLFEHHVRVGAAHAGRHHAGAAWALAPPFTDAGRDVERRRGEIDLRVRLAEVQARRNLPVLEREHGLDHAGEPRGRVEVPEVGLHRAEGAVAPPLRVGAERLGERGHLDRIADRRAGAVRLDVAHGVGVDPGIGQRLDDGVGLRRDAGRGIARLRGAVVVDCGSLDQRMNAVAVGERVGKPLEHEHAAARAEHRAVRPGVERPHAAVGRHHARAVVDVARAMRHAHRDRADQRHVGLAGKQALAREVHGDERGRARGLHREARALQVQLVRDARREKVLVVRDQRRDVVFGDARVQPDVRVVGVERGPAVDPDASGIALRVVARVLERLVRQLEQDALLRVDGLRFHRRVAEERRVEAAGVVQHRGRVHIAWKNFLVREPRDRLDAGGKVAPELIEIVRTGQPARHADDGDVLVVIHSAQRAPCGRPCRSR